MTEAFVIMPYAKEYERFYKFIIRSAVEKCGLECVRQDFSNQGGHILKNVIQAIAEAEIVIADISGLNWNVAYELGLRHVMNKNGTILLCDDQTELPFDISALNIIKYPKNWLELDGVDEKIEKQIVDLIQASMTHKERSDSPVHDVYPTLPSCLVEFLSSHREEKSQKRLAEMSEQLKTLTEENKRLQNRIEEMGLDASENPEETEEDLEAIFHDAYMRSNLNSDDAVATLRELLDEGKKEEFITFLAKVLKYGYLDVIDCRNIYKFCRRLGIPEITKKHLETVVKFYPEDQELMGFLAREYSNDYRDKDKAISLVNEMIGLTRRDGKYNLSGQVLSFNMLGSFFTVYLNLRKYEELLKVAELLLKQYGSNLKLTKLIYRNIASASRKLQKFEDARAALEKAIQLDPYDDMTYHSAFLLERELENPKEAYENLERCIAIDPEDEDYYNIIAGLICDDSVARIHGNVELHITKEERKNYASAFILAGLERNLTQEVLNSAVNFLKRNGFADVLEKLMGCIHEERRDFRECFSELDFSVVEYCYSLHMSEDEI